MFLCIHTMPKPSKDFSSRLKQNPNSLLFLKFLCYGLIPAHHTELTSYRPLFLVPFSLSKFDKFINIYQIFRNMKEITRRIKSLKILNECTHDHEASQVMLVVKKPTQET